MATQAVDGAAAAERDPTEAARGRLRAAAPGPYHWTAHVALIAAFAAGGIAVALAGLGPLRAADAVALALMLLAIVLGEYAAHRWSMHRKSFPRAVYHRHVHEHHVFFTAERMWVDQLDDLRWVLFPTWALPLLVASILPFAALLWWLASRRAAWLLVLAVIVYYGIYEVVHALAHLPTRPTRLGRAIAAATRHHRIHHDPALMKRWNFNFALPLGDWLWGTTWREDRAAGGRGSRPGEA